MQLLTEFDFEQAQQFASEIEQYNSDRKDLDKQITKEALQIEENEEKERFPSYQENWHKGVIVLLPRRLKLITDQLWFSKAVINMPPQHVPCFDVYNALEACSQHLEQLADTCVWDDFERRKLFPVQRSL
jgi:single-stranded-DNA-specific exonuclease